MRSLVEISATAVPWLLMAAGLSWLSLRLGGVAFAALPVLTRSPRLDATESGTAVLEFLLVFPLFLMTALVLVQVIFIVNAQLLVKNAAFCAARSAAVWSEQPGGHAQSEAEAAAIVGLLPAAGTAQQASFRLELAPLIVMDSPPRGLFRQLAWISRKYDWARGATTVALSSHKVGHPQGPLRSVTADVEHKFHLSVPYGGPLLGRLMGERFRGRPVLPLRATSTLLAETKLRSRLKLDAPPAQGWLR